jgi:hypothetical protein
VTTSMDDLVQFLRARLDDDAATATAAGGGPWTDEEGFADVDPWFELPAELANHALRHDPARVLAEVDAKRQILDGYAQLHTSRDRLHDTALHLQHHVLGSVVRLLALPYADHPDYQDAWRP